MGEERHDVTGDPFDRLRAIDPARPGAYAHADADSMVDRIVAAPRGRHARRRRSVLAPLAATLAAGATAVALGLAATPAAPSALMLSNASVQAHPQVPSPAGLGAPIFWSQGSGAAATPTCAGCGSATYLYALGGPLPATVPAERAYPAEAAGSPTALLGALARGLGVHGAAVRAGRSWQVRAASPTGSPTASLRRDPISGLFLFTYARAARATAAGCAELHATPATVVDRAATEASLAATLGSLGLRYDLAEPRFEAGVSTACSPLVSLAEQVVVGGLPTDQVVGATYAASGRVVALSLPVFTVGPATSLPLVSAASAVGALIRTSDAAEHVTNAPMLGSGRPGQPAFQRRTVDEGSALSTVSSRLVTVEIRAATPALRAFATSEGTWLLPVYDLAGDGYSALARPGPTPWAGTVLATAPSVARVHGTRAGAPIVFDQRPIP